MKFFLSKFLNMNEDFLLLTEQNKQLGVFCASNATTVNEKNSPHHLAAMEKVDNNISMYTSKKTSQSNYKKPIPFEQASVINAAYGSALIELIAKMYCNPSLHFYLIMDQVEVLPYLKRLLSLSRITLINHQKALNPLPVLPSETQIFISVPEFHPKRLTSEYRTYIHGHACMFSTYSWLLSAKKNLPSYFLNVEQNLVLVKHPSDMYKDLSLSYQSPNGSIYSWSRLKNHKVERLEKVFISQVNQLEALLRHLRPRLESTDLQPTFAAIKHQKTVVLQRNRS